MKFINKSNIIRRNIKSHLILFFILVVVFFILDFISSNSDFFKYKLNNLETQYYSVDDGILYGFELIDNQLISLNEDPNVTIFPIDIKVGYLSIDCSNTNPEANAQVFFRGEGKQFNENNSIIFKLSSKVTKLELSDIQEVNSIRFDLTNQKGDSITCQEIIINPPIPYHFGWGLAALFLILFVFVIFFSQLEKSLQLKIKNKFFDYSFWLFILLIVLVDLIYPITITWDSGHYLWLADIISEADWSNWDPIRYILFPLILYASQQLFGLSQNALLIPMIFSHLVLFFTSYLLVLELFQFQEKKSRFLVQLLVFFVIAVDATIVGYFHTLLTEYVAATIAVLSSYIAIKLYKSELFSKQFYWLSTYFLLMVPIAWHLKQPYIGSAYFPFIVSCFLIILRKLSKKSLLYGLTANLLIIAVVFLSTLAWNSFLALEGNQMKTDRLVSTKLDRQLGGKINVMQDQPIWLVKDIIKRYLASTNLFQYDHKNRVLIYEPCYICAFQNEVVGQRMFFNQNQTNLVYSPPYDSYTRYYVSNYNPPDSINNLFQFYSKISNFIFTISYLLLPFLIFIFFIFWIKNKDEINSALLILSISSIMNSIAHIILMNSVLDRYRFWGYVLNLIILTIMIFQVLKINLHKIVINNR